MVDAPGLRPGRQSYLLALILASAACAPGVTVLRSPGEPAHPAQVIAVEPFILRFAPDSADPVPLGERLALHVAEQQTYAVLGPSDLGLTDGGLLELPLPAEGGVVARTLGIPVSDVVVLRGWGEWHLRAAEKKSAPAGQATPSPAPGGRGAGRGGGPAPDRPSEDNLYSAHLQLLDSAGHVLAEAEMSSSPSSDLGPAVDRLAERMLIVMAEATPGRRVPRQRWWRETSLTVSGPRVEVPTPMASAAGLHPDDVVLTIGGEPPTDLVIERQLHLAKEGSTIPVLIRRAGAELTLQLPAVP
jgi:hypothetical protein